MSRPRTAQELIHWLEVGEGARWLRLAAVLAVGLALSLRVAWTQFRGPLSETTLIQADTGRQLALGRGHATGVNFPQTAAVLEQRAKDVSMKMVEAEMDAGYGIYAGGTQHWAVLRFSAQAAPWISREEWHPLQRGRWLADGAWELTLPYVEETELVMDVLRQGEQVQVIEPAALREAVRRRLELALAAYA